MTVAGKAGRSVPEKNSGGPAEGSPLPVHAGYNGGAFTGGLAPAAEMVVRERQGKQGRSPCGRLPCIVAVINENNDLSDREKTMRILVLEDAASTRLLIKKRLEKAGHRVDSADNGHQGFQRAAANPYDVIISDLYMPHWDGFKFIEAVEVVCPHLPIIIVSSATGDQDVAARLASCRNVRAMLSKPVDFEALFELLAAFPEQSFMAVSKRARIICTIGPASSTPEVLGRMVLAGMDVARLNFSHGSHEQHEQALAAVRQAEKEWQKPIAVMQDLCGPKIRTGPMLDGGIELEAGKRLVIQKQEVLGTPERISTIVPEIIDDLKVGDPVLLDDGLIEITVVGVSRYEAICEVVTGGVLKSGKGINLPGTSLSMPGITRKDRRDLEWALKQSVDYVALSFIRSAAEIHEIKQYITASDRRGMRVIAKIEKPEAVNNIKEIIEAADGIMIARGDLGVELPAARVPRIQQQIIRLCRHAGKPVITATQMLDSMTLNRRPTRAEVTDVSTAIAAGTDAVMLSQETAVGVDPVHVVRTMAGIIFEQEQYGNKPEEEGCPDGHEDGRQPIIDVVAMLDSIAATLLLDPAGILYPRLSQKSRSIPSILVTRSLQAARHASMYKNVIPIIIETEMRRDAVISLAMARGIKMGCFSHGDLIAVVEGSHLTQSGLQQSGAIQLVRVDRDKTAEQA